MHYCRFICHRQLSLQCFGAASCHYLNHHVTNITAKILLDAVKRAVPRHSPFFLLTAINVKFCNFSCDANCTATFCKPQIQLNHNLLMSNVTIRAAKLSLFKRKKNPLFFLDISVKTAPSIILEWSSFCFFCYFCIIRYINYIGMFYWMLIFLCWRKNNQKNTVSTVIL